MLARVHDIQLRDKQNRYIQFRLRVVRAEVLGPNPLFHLVLQDEVLLREEEGIKKILRENFAGHEVLDEVTGLPDRASLIRDMELVQHHASSKEFTACFATMTIDHLHEIVESHGEQVALQAIKHVGMVCRQRLRTDDMVGVVDTNVLGLLLLYITPESSRVVLNRLRWAISTMPHILDHGEKLTVTVSVSFAMLDHGAPEGILRQCEKDLKTLHQAGWQCHQPRAGGLTNFTIFTCDRQCGAPWFWHAPRQPV